MHNDAVTTVGIPFDAVDFYAAAGVSVKTVEALRVGVEYVGQEFEDAWEREEAEGGVRVEDMVVVTADGCTNLNRLPEGLIWK